MAITNKCNGNNCSRCGECCTPFIPISEAELKKVYKYVKEHKEIVKKIKEKYNDLPNHDKLKCQCCFYVDNSCLVYPVRPWICKKFKCDQTQEEIEQNKNYAISKAKYNKNGFTDLNDFWNLIFGEKFMIEKTLEDFGFSKDKYNEIAERIKKNEK